jgi:hypothetical protein
MIALIFTDMIGRGVAVMLVLLVATVGCGRGRPSSGPIEKFAACPATPGPSLIFSDDVSLAPYPPAHVQPPADGVVISPPPQTVHVQSFPDTVMISPPEGTAVHEWRLVVISGGEHLCRDTANYSTADLANVEGTSAGSVVLEATDSSDHRARVTLVFS